MSWSVHPCVGSDCRNMMIPLTFASHRVRVRIQCQSGTGGRQRDGRRKRTHLEVHLLELLAPVHEERGANVQVELRERICAFRLRM